MAMRESHNESKSTTTETGDSCWTEDILLVDGGMGGEFLHD
jgi:hypothetical protein